MAAPTEPQYLRVRPSTDTTANLTWQTPYKENGRIRFYEVEWHCGYSMSGLYYVPKSEEGDIEQFTLTRLEPGSYCEASVRVRQLRHERIRDLGTIFVV